MRRRRRWLLLALVPTALGIATLGIGWMALEPRAENAPSLHTPVVQGPTTETPPSGEPSGAGEGPHHVPLKAVAPSPASLPPRPSTPSSDESSSEPAQVSTPADPGEASGPVLHAQSDSTSNGEPAQLRRPIRLVSLSPVGLPPGGGGRGGSDDENGGSGPVDPGSGEPSNNAPPAQGSDSTPADESGPGDDQPSNGSNGSGDEGGSNDGSNDGSSNPGPGGGSGDENEGEDGNGGSGPDDSTPWIPHDPDDEPVRVPEPGTLGLLLLGLAGCALRRRR